MNKRHQSQELHAKSAEKCDGRSSCAQCAHACRFSLGTTACDQCTDAPGMGACAEERQAGGPAGEQNCVQLVA